MPPSHVYMQELGENSSAAPRPVWRVLSRRYRRHAWQAKFPGVVNPGGVWLVEVSAWAQASSASANVGWTLKAARIATPCSSGMIDVFGLVMTAR